MYTQRYSKQGSRWCLDTVYCTSWEVLRQIWLKSREAKDSPTINKQGSQKMRVQVWLSMMYDDCWWLLLLGSCWSGLYMNPHYSILRILPKHWSAFWRLSNLITSHQMFQDTADFTLRSTSVSVSYCRGHLPSLGSRGKLKFQHWTKRNCLLLQDWEYVLTPARITTYMVRVKDLLSGLRSTLPTALFQKLGMNRTGLNRTRLGSPSSVQRLPDTPWIFILKKLGCHNARTSWKLENGVLTSKT